MDEAPQVEEIKRLVETDDLSCGLDNIMQLPTTFAHPSRMHHWQCIADVTAFLRSAPLIRAARMEVDRLVGQKTLWLENRDSGWMSRAFGVPISSERARCSHLQDLHIVIFKRAGCHRYSIRIEMFTWE